MSKYSLLFLLICLAALTSCDTLLEETPDTFEDEAQVFATEAGVETAVNGLYYAYSEMNYHGGSFHNLVMPLSGKFWSSQNSNIDASSLNTASNNNNLSQLWPQMYQTINTANLIINNLEGTNERSNAETALGQAYFIRALTFFDLVRFFGAVPLRTETTTVDNLNLPRTSVDEVYAQIIADLELAESLLPAAGTYLEGRPQPMAATAFLAKIYLTRASMNNDMGFYQMAKDHALEVVNSNAYSLTPTFAELFELTNENTSESIFELQYGHTGGARNADFARNYTLSDAAFLAANLPVFGRIRPNKETFDDHLEQYPGDPRIDGTFLYNEYEKQDGSIRTIYPERVRGNDGYAGLAKYLDPTYNGTTTAHNMIILRYADVLLMLAEAENELNGPEAAYPYVNEVLARARTTADGQSAAQPANYAGMDQETFRARIRAERLFELLGEGHAWFDTRRFGYDYLLNEVIVKHNTHPTFDDGKDFIYPDDEKNMLLPLPLAEISGNQNIGVDEQNPGY